MRGAAGIMIAALLLMFCVGSASAQKVAEGVSATASGLSIFSRDGRLMMQSDNAMHIEVTAHADRGAGLRGRLTGRRELEAFGAADITDSIVGGPWSGVMPQPLRRVDRAMSEVVGIRSAEGGIEVRCVLWCGYVSEHRFGDMIAQEGWLPVEVSVLVSEVKDDPQSMRTVVVDSDMPAEYAAAVHRAVQRCNRRAKGLNIEVVSGTVSAADRFAVAADAAHEKVSATVLRGSDGTVRSARINIGAESLQAVAFARWIEAAKTSGPRMPDMQGMRIAYLESRIERLADSLAGRVAGTKKSSYGAMRRCIKRSERCADEVADDDLRKAAVEVKYAQYEAVATTANRRQLGRLAEWLSSDAAEVPSRDYKSLCHRQERVWRRLFADSDERQIAELLTDVFERDMNRHRWISQYCCFTALCGLMNEGGEVAERVSAEADSLTEFWRSHTSDDDVLVSAFAQMLYEKLRLADERSKDYKNQ